MIFNICNIRVQTYVVIIYNSGFSIHSFQRSAGYCESFAVLVAVHNAGCYIADTELSLRYCRFSCYDRYIVITEQVIYTAKAGFRIVYCPRIVIRIVGSYLVSRCHQCSIMIDSINDSIVRQAQSTVSIDQFGCCTNSIIRTVCKLRVPVGTVYGTQINRQVSLCYM